MSGPGTFRKLFGGGLMVIGAAIAVGGIATSRSTDSPASSSASANGRDVKSNGDIAMGGVGVIIVGEISFVNGSRAKRTSAPTRATSVPAL